MNLSSLSFLTLFLPVALGLCWMFRRGRVWLLLILSLIFAFWHDGLGVLWLVASVILTDVCGRWIHGCQTTSTKKWICGGAVTANLLLLGFFKYSGFALDTVNRLAGSSFSQGTLWAPLGISFFTFSSISYLVDLYRGKIVPARTPLESACYLVMFPKLTAGPIARYSEVAESLHQNPPIPADLIVSGFRRFLSGMAKKVLLADTVGAMADSVWQLAGEGHGMSASMAWLGLLSYALQLYFDFSGYSDMAIGVGRMLGFRFEENFRYPYAATSIRDFWRRWHISLSLWFRDYLYIPLGGNRRGKIRACLNSLVVFVLCGLWHNAGWMFVLWGLWHGLFITVERLMQKPKGAEKAPASPWKKSLSHVYASLVFLLGWILFRSQGFADFGVMLQSLGGVADISRESRILWLEVTPTYLVAFCIGLLLVYPVVPYVRGKLRRWVPQTLLFCAENVFLTILTIVSFFFLAGASYHAFLYQQF